MSELFLGALVLTILWAASYEYLIDSAKGLQSACHDIKERRVKHRKRMAELKNELNDIKRRLKK